MQRFLRIQVMRSGGLIDDRYVQRDVTIGSHTLFRVEEGRPILAVCEGVTGELALDGKTPRSLAELAPEGLPVESGWQLDLPEPVRGWVRLGSLTFYLHIEPRPLPIPVRLPPGTRAGLMSGLETGFVAALVAVVSLESLGIYAVHNRPYLEPDEPTELPDQGIVVTAPPAPPEPPTRPVASRSDAPRAPSPTHHPAVTPGPSDRPTVAQRVEDTVEGLWSKPVEEIVGHDSDDVDAAFQAVHSRTNVASIDPVAHRCRQDTVTGKCVDDDAPATIVPGPLVGPRDRHDPLPNLAPNPIKPDILVGPIEPPPGPTGPIAAGLLAAIKAKLKGLRRCYDKELKQDPSLHGTMELDFVVKPEGHTSEVLFESDTLHNSNVDDCMRLMMSTWRLPPVPAETPLAIPLIFAQEKRP